MIGFQSISEFADAWNSVDKEYDFLFLICHGSPGTLDRHKEYLGIDSPEYAAGMPYRGYDFDEMLTNTISLRKGAILFSCHGATEGNHGLSAAQIIAGKTGNVGVLAMKKASVKYRSNTGIPIPAVGKKTIGNICNYLFCAEWVIQYMPKENGE